MKLKMESIEGATVLVVSETIDTAHVAVLKAGLSKLFQSGKKLILLDFSTMTPSEMPALAVSTLIFGLRTWALSSDAQVLVINPFPTFGHVKSREEGILLFKSGRGQLQAIEAKIQEDIKALEIKRSALQERIIQTAADDPKDLLTKNSRLKIAIAETERLTHKFLKLRSRESLQFPDLELAQESLEHLLNDALKKEGILQ